MIAAVESEIPIEPATLRNMVNSAAASALSRLGIEIQFQLAIRESAQAIQNFTTQVGDPTGIATGRMYQTMIEQSRFLAYIDVFTILSAVALLLIPFCLLPALPSLLTGESNKQNGISNRATALRMVKTSM